ncbi:DUF5721 family protein [Lachnospiraceae bacterium OttesenSCG-928-E19]|nr:DUF5721 family protein [Lachnospiraceae bacterium OttesenSCG-928-E19]
MLVIKPQTKLCMSELLLKETFDSFSFIEGEITTFNKFHIDGFLQKRFFTDEEAATIDTLIHSTWKDVRKFCYNIISGVRTPLDFKFILSFPPTKVENFLSKHNIAISSDNIQGLYLNFRFNGEELQCITGTSFTTFLPDKSLEHSWDDFAKELFVQYNIPFEIVE